MKKIKKLFSKLVTLTLLFAMLVPYTSIPKVEAETSDGCENGTWEYRSNYYFFLQAENPHTWASYFANSEDNDNFTTNYYTSFLYNFPSDGSTMEIIEDESGFVQLDNDEDYNKDFDPTKDDWTAGQFYYEYAVREGNGAAGDYQSYSYTSDNDGKSSENSIATYLFHGPWANAGTGDKVNLNKNGGRLFFNDGGVDLTADSGVKNHIENFVNASIFIDSDEAEISNAKIAYSQTGNIDYSLKGIENQIIAFNNGKGQYDQGSFIRKNDGNPVIELLISRTYFMEDIFTNALSKQVGVNGVNKVVLGSMYFSKDWNRNSGIYAFDSEADRDNQVEDNAYRLYFPGSKYAVGYVCEDNSIAMGIATACPDGKVKTDTDGNPLLSYSDYVTNSYITLDKGYEDGSYVTGSNSDSWQKNSIEVSKQKSYYLETTEDDGTDWIFAPTLYKIAYRVCKANSDEAIPGEKVTITYDGNTENVSNVPSADTIEIGKDYIVSTQKPTASGKVFQIWHTDKNCKEGKKIEPGATLTGLTSNQTLYACWGESGTTPTKPTGVLTYAGLFTGIIALAGGAYYVVKKKNLFKKI